MIERRKGILYAMMNSAMSLAHSAITRTSTSNAALLTTACALLAAVQACGASPPVEVERRDAARPVDFQLRNPVTCIIKPVTNAPYGLERTVQPHERRDDRIRVTYTWKNDCPSSIRLYDMSILVWDNPDRTGRSIGTSVLDDIDIEPASDAEIQGVVLLDDGYRSVDIEGPDNVEMNFNVRYADQ